MAPFPEPVNFTACLFANCSGGCLDGVCINPISSPPPPPLAPDSVSIAVQHKSKLLPNFLISAASLLALSFLLLLLFYSLLRLRRRNRRRRRDQLQQQAAAQHQPPHQDDIFLGGDGDQDDGAPHHVWFIRTVGLDESVIKSIAAVVYKSGDGLIDGGDCTVCLGEFSDGEVIKLLPKCAHAFHLSCIDTWLRSHVNCPLCRAPVVAPAAMAVPAEEADECVRIEVQPEENQEESAIAIDLTAGSSSSSGPLEVEDEVQPIRRSVSMDASSLARLMMRAEPESEKKLGEERKELELREVVISKNRGKGVDCCAEKQPAVELNRSLSSRSGRFFFSKYARGRSASVLPL